MDSIQYLQRAENEFILSTLIQKITLNKDIQENIFKIEEPQSFFSSVITHSYYCIFYSAKAYLIKKGIKTTPPEEHKNTFNEFKKLVDKGILDIELLKIYSKAIIEADTLLNIFKIEKSKRGKFTYQKLSQANKQPAEESLKNAKFFFSNTNLLLHKRTNLDIVSI